MIRGHVDFTFRYGKIEPHRVFSKLPAQSIGSRPLEKRHEELKYLHQNAAHADITQEQLSIILRLLKSIP